MTYTRRRVLAGLGLVGLEAAIAPLDQKAGASSLTALQAAKMGVGSLAYMRGILGGLPRALGCRTEVSVESERMISGESPTSRGLPPSLSLPAV